MAENPLAVFGMRPVVSDRERARGRLMVASAAFFWGTSATLARFVFRDLGTPALTVVELRLWIAASLLGAWLLWRRPAALRVRREDRVYLLILGLFGVAAVQGTYYYSISRLGVGLAILIQYLAPALLVLYHLARGQRPSTATTASVLLALVGTSLLVGATRSSPNPSPSPGDWAVGFGSAFAFAFYVQYSKRGLARYPPETVLFYTFLVAATFWSCVTPPWRIAAAGYSPDLWAMFAALGVFSTLVPFAFFYAGLGRLGAVEAAVVATLEPVVAVIAAWIFLGEGLGWLQTLGAALVLVATVLVSLAPKPEAPAEHASAGAPVSLSNRD